MNILGIESSCDETAAAVFSYTKGEFKELSNVVFSQIPIHQKTQGVVPEVAARAHVGQMIPVLEKALKGVGNATARVNLESKIDAIAVTGGPGLNTTLLVGVETAKTLGYMFDKPVVRVNHLHAHLMATRLLNKKIEFPALGLIVSGGHTDLVWMESFNKGKVIGSTLDDAAGEAFDKVAKMLGLDYPGGPAIEARAKRGDLAEFKFPRPMLDVKGFDFSFSGLKTSVRYKLDSFNLAERARYTSDIAASFQKAVVDSLVGKTLQAAEKLKPKSILLAGGVSANTELRDTLTAQVKEHFSMTPIIAPFSYSTDNAAMIAAAGATVLEENPKLPSPLKLTADPNWELPRKLARLS